uniref:Uncharacterized protein n=1 Tax=Colacium vesiculosum TaxID=102910 RepID=I6NI09_9EUGL|nr:hypothetical protein [Colacium vesiculosum]
MNTIINNKYISLNQWAESNNIPFQNCLKLAKSYQVALGRFGSSYIIDLEELNRALEKEIQRQFIQKKFLSEKLKKKSEERNIYKEHYRKAMAHGGKRLEEDE